MDDWNDEVIRRLVAERRREDLARGLAHRRVANLPGSHPRPNRLAIVLSFLATGLDALIAGWPSRWLNPWD